MQNIPVIRTKNLIITLLSSSYYRAFKEYEYRNNLHLSPWQPLRNDNYFTEHETKERIKNNYQQFIRGTSVTLIAMPLSKEGLDGDIIAIASFTNIVRGIFLACNLGYSIDKEYEGRGIMHEMMQTSINYMFTEQGMHRIMANYMENNKRSENLLRRLSFNKEGLAKSYLKINGSWHDHVLTSLINPKEL